ncbi:MAG: cell division protein ZapB [Desulfuromonadaceae bacterium]|nr:cell division protein ZapB [Desulfuromonadaceae bacterium]MDD5104462.1 cell division protein ZapB [Desulfuromonadaceae bacterium]
MPSSRHEKPVRHGRGASTELCDINQLGLDFNGATSYSMHPRKEPNFMDQNSIDALEKKIGELIEKYTSLKEENALLNDELQRLAGDREAIKARVDAILGTLDGI